MLRTTAKHWARSEGADYLLRRHPEGYYYLEWNDHRNASCTAKDFHRVAPPVRLKTFEKDWSNRWLPTKAVYRRVAEPRSRTCR
jgi:hypothetical protein